MISHTDSSILLFCRQFYMIIHPHHEKPRPKLNLGKDAEKRPGKSLRRYDLLKERRCPSAKYLTCWRSVLLMKCYKCDPPLASMHWPVIQRLSGEARNAATSAISNGSPHLPKIEYSAPNL